MVADLGSMVHDILECTTLEVYVYHARGTDVVSMLSRSLLVVLPVVASRG